MKAVIYARYSSSNQREESIEGQLRECHDYAKKNGFEVIGEYCDYALTGTNDKRPEFRRMIKDSEKKQFQAVLIYNLDRFARDRYDSAIYKAKLKKNGVRVFYAKLYIPDEPEGIILESVMEGYAEYYSKNLSRTIKRGLKENALHGLAMGAVPPLGYKVNKDTKKYEIEPVGAKAVQEIFELYASGVSSAQIVKHLNNKGIKTSHGNSFGKNSLHCILTNDKYIGMYRYMDVEVEDGVPAIISKDLFERVQAMRKHNLSCRARTKANEDYLLTTKLFCGKCGNPMVGESGTSKNGTMYYYYKCSNAKVKKCDKKAVKKEWIENLVVNEIVARVFTDEAMEEIATKAFEYLNKENSDSTYLDSLKARMKDNKSKIENIMKAVEAGMYSENLKIRLAELEEESKDLEVAISQEEIKLPTLTKEHILYWLEQFRNGDIEDATYRRTLVDTFVNSIFLYDNPDGGRRLVVTFNISDDDTKTLKCSDIDCSSSAECANSNFFYLKNTFGFVLEIKA